MSEKRVGLSKLEGRELVRALRDLGNVSAPPSLAGAVLAEVGLAEGYWETDSPIGRIYVAYSKTGVSAVMRSENADSFERAFRNRFHRPVHRVAGPPPALKRRVEAVLKGERIGAIDFDLRGLTEFERAVLMKALEIPRGEVRPYAWIAREIGSPAAVRAVGTALANNPVPLLIPCHRVVKSDGRVGNYAFGPEAKRAVLEQEGMRVDEIENLALRGIRYLGSDTTKIYCFPTCRHARRVTDRHRVQFASALSASAAGYRPCRVCRPG